MTVWTASARYNLIIFIHCSIFRSVGRVDGNKMAIRRGISLFDILGGGVVVCEGNFDEEY